MTWPITSSILVLARIEGAPAGIRGVSLFVVPKVLVNADGSLGARQRRRCGSIEATRWASTAIPPA